MKKIMVIVIAIVILAGAGIGIYTGVIQPAQEKAAVNKAMKGYFDSYVYEWNYPYMTSLKGNFTEEQKQQIIKAQKQLEITYKKNVKEVGERKLEKKDKNTYMVTSRKEAPNDSKIGDYAKAKLMGLDLPEDVNEAQKKLVNYAANIWNNEMMSSTNLEQFNIEVKVVKQDGQWKAVESNGVVLADKKGVKF